MQLDHLHAHAAAERVNLIYTPCKVWRNIGLGREEGHGLHALAWLRGRHAVRPPLVYDDVSTVHGPSASWHLNPCSALLGDYTELLR
jgi:hypothetical protein